MPSRREVPLPRLYKTIFEARYQPKLEIFGLMHKAMQTLTGYPDWEVSTASTSLRDYDEYCSLTLQHNRFVYDQDSDDQEIEKSRISDALNHLPHDVHISSFSRLGFRRKYLIPVSMSFEELVSILNMKLFSPDNELKKTLPSNIDDIQYAIDASEGLLKFHITVGPLKREEIPRYISFTKKHHLRPQSAALDYDEITKGYPDISVFIDIDIYKESKEIPSEEASDFVNDARNRVETMTENLRIYLFNPEIGV